MTGSVTTSGCALIFLNFRSAVRNRPQAVFIASGWSISSSVLVSVTMCSSSISTVIPPSQKPEHPSLRPLLPFQFDPLPAAQVGDRDLLVVNLENAPELAVRRRDDASRLDHVVADHSSLSNRSTPSGFAAHISSTRLNPLSSSLPTPMAWLISQHNGLTNTVSGHPLCWSRTHCECTAISSASNSGVILTSRSCPSSRLRIWLTILFFLWGVSLGANSSTSAITRFTPAKQITLRSIMDAPPQPTEGERGVGRERKKPEGAEGEEKARLCDVAEEESTEHPEAGEEARVQQPAVRLAPLAHGLPALPPRARAERRIDQDPEAARPRSDPEPELCALGAAYHRHGCERKERREWHEDDEDQQRFQQPLRHRVSFVTATAPR